MSIPVSKYHLGEDWNAESGGNTDCGLPVYSVANGTSSYADIASGWGRVLIVRHTLPDGSQVESLYGHLASFAKTSGDVARGDQIGTIGDGSEGGATYPCHLHLEIRTAACPNWGRAGQATGGTTSKAAGWTDPSDFIDSKRQVLGLNDGLVAYYPFNGNADDASGNGNDGIVNGARPTTDRFGRSSSAYRFTLTQNIQSARNIGIAGNAERTISLWFEAGAWPDIVDGIEVADNVSWAVHWDAPRYCFQMQPWCLSFFDGRLTLIMCKAKRLPMFWAAGTISSGLTRQIWEARVFIWMAGFSSTTLAGMVRLPICSTRSTPH